jgi:hypothetical protein
MSLRECLEIFFIYKFVISISMYNKYVINQCSPRIAVSLQGDDCVARRIGRMIMMMVCANLYVDASSGGRGL